MLLSNVICRMVDRIHTLIIHHEDTLLDWKVDEDRFNYMGLCSSLYEELYVQDDFAREITLNITISAKVRGIEGVIVVVDDASVMRMFAKNVNTANPIHLFVGFDEVETTIDLEDTSNKQGKSSARVWEIEDKAVIGAARALVVYGGT